MLQKYVCKFTLVKKSFTNVNNTFADCQVNDYDDDSDDDVIVIDSDNEAIRTIKKKHRKVVAASSRCLYYK